MEVEFFHFHKELREKEEQEKKKKKIKCVIVPTVIHMRVVPSGPLLWVEVGSFT